MILSVNISTYNRSKHCQQAIKSVIHQVTRTSYEIIVIDNGTKSTTKKMIQKLQSKFSNIHYYQTRITGLAHARNLGWKKARGEYIAYLDDDAIASPDWIKSIDIFITKHPKVAIFGGLYTSSNQDEIPRWIPAELTSKILPGKKDRSINLGLEWLNGTNIIIKKSLLKKLDGFDESLGVNAGKRAYGEETDLQIRASNAGILVWYSPKIKVEHFFATEKQNIIYLLKNQFIHGQNSHQVFKLLKQSNKSATASTSINRLFQKNIPLKRRVYYLLSPICYLLGKLIKTI
jgi:glucosyl-dolichyl phosphate glucuronosyltransferase